jgi:transcription elongation factor GreA
VVTVTESATTWLTRDAYDRLKHELDGLIAQRPALAEEINAKREEGDLRENQAYLAAREEQAKVETRIRQLQRLLRSAKVGEIPRQGGVAEPGMVLTVRYEDDETESFLLASRAAAHGDTEVYSPESPIGHALLGAREGETREYELPSGDRMHVTLIKAEPYRA